MLFCLHSGAVKYFFPVQLRIAWHRQMEKGTNMFENEFRHSELEG